ncbi:MAG: hypothetical protein ING73_11220 [Rhodocyclaceae bacterium]|nr:hypothetical protein [Rhodocyclaceae bacterium]
MKNVKFPVVYSQPNNSGVIVYPDDIEKFSNVEVVGAFIYAAYSGALPLEEAESPVVADPSAWFISKDKFNARLSMSEAVAIELAQVDDPSASMQARQLAAAIRVVEKQKSQAVFLDLTPSSANRARIEAGLNVGKSAGIFTDARIAELMVKPTEAERYRG